MDDKIQDALNTFDFERARELLRIALQQNPTAQTYYLAAQVAINDRQKREFLQKALSLDPFHKAANQELQTQNKGEPLQRKTSYLSQYREKFNMTNKGGGNSVNPSYISFDKKKIPHTLIAVGILGVLALILVVAYLLPNLTGPKEYTAELTYAQSQPVGAIPANTNASTGDLIIMPSNYYDFGPTTNGSYMSIVELRILNLSDAPINMDIQKIGISIIGTKSLCNTMGFNCFSQRTFTERDENGISYHFNKLDLNTKFNYPVNSLKILPATFTLNPQEEITGAVLAPGDANLTPQGKGGLGLSFSYPPFFTVTWNNRDGITS